MEVIEKEKPYLQTVSAGGLDFKFSSRSSNQEINAHTKGVDGLPLILSISHYYIGEELLASACHFLSEEHGPSGYTPMLRLTAARGTDLQQVADRLVAVKFERVRHLGTDWLLSSTGHAAALDGQGEMITVSPGLIDDSWSWERESLALEAFNQATSSFYRLQGMNCPNREAAMIQALAAKEKLRSSSVALALAIGLTVIS
ncbi:MAG: hypothetical protein ACK4FJ_16905 [Ferrovibrio sp.]|uniref:hypothetical protein n=1 Tax=Ferrovibrio sp. TaxID=1917215 RepID=UPI00391C514F